MPILHCEMLGGIAVITLEVPSLDQSNASDVAARLAEAIPEEDPAIVDLGAVRYFDLSGFARILKWAARPAVRLCSRSGSVHALLELLRADAVITLYQSREEALASLPRRELPMRRTASA
ncbi:MAG TPA: STAS domain-containing protein [Terriglobales bacterium]|nr:STAS domain-containing protein [Terriglobales bacterium]